MNPVDQMLLDSLVMQLELGKLKKPGNITMEILPSGPVRSMEDDEHETAESMYHEMFESEEDDSKKFVDEDDYVDDVEDDDVDDDEDDEFYD
jgi:hypothetical protein